MLLKIMEFVFVLISMFAFIRIIQDIVLYIALTNYKLSYWLYVHNKIVIWIITALLFASIYISWQIVEIYG